MSIESDAIASALHCLKNGARVWDAIDVLEQAQEQLEKIDTARRAAMNAWLAGMNVAYNPYQTDGDKQ